MISKEEIKEIINIYNNIENSLKEIFFKCPISHRLENILFELNEIYEQAEKMLEDYEKIRNPFLKKYKRNSGKLYKLIRFYELLGFERNNSKFFYIKIKNEIYQRKSIFYNFRLMCLKDVYTIVKSRLLTKKRKAKYFVKELKKFCREFNELIYTIENWIEHDKINHFIKKPKVIHSLKICLLPESKEIKAFREHENIGIIELSNILDEYFKLPIIHLIKSKAE